VPSLQTINHSDQLVRCLSHNTGKPKQ